MRTHGKDQTYTAGCRCDLCRAAHRIMATRQQRSREARLRADPLIVVHGLMSTYSNWGCRCDLCREGRRLGRVSYEMGAL